VHDRAQRGAHRETLSSPIHTLRQELCPPVWWQRSSTTLFLSFQVLRHLNGAFPAMVRGPRSRKLVPLNLLQCSARYLFMYHETSSRSSYSSSGAVIFIEIAAQNFMDFAVVGGQLPKPKPARKTGKGPTNFGSCNCISIRKLLIKCRRRGKECAIQFAVPTESAVYANEFSFVL